MTDLQRHIKPCPYCNRPASIERVLYAPDGHQLAKAEEHPDWIAKCPECGARTADSYTRVSAIIAWNRGQFNRTTYVLHQPRTTRDPHAWESLAGAIFRAAFDDYKLAYKAKLLTHKPGAVEGEHALVKSIPYLKQRARDEARYDIWRDRMDCYHCAMKPHQCRHKTGDYWREYKQHRAPGCPRREGDDYI